MALMLFENGWDSYDMDWENPDPYNPIYLQALQYAAWERCRMEWGGWSYDTHHFSCPYERTPMNYDAYISLYNNIRGVIERNVFVYKPGEEPDGKQTYYSEEIEYNYGYYIPYYVFCPISFEHTGSEFNSFSKFLQFPRADADVPTWQEWLKSAKEVISCCKYVRVEGALHLYNHIAGIDEYKEERPEGVYPTRIYRPIASIYSYGDVHKDETSRSYNTAAFLDLCNAWGTASTTSHYYGLYSDTVDTDLSGCTGHRNRWTRRPPDYSLSWIHHISLSAWLKSDSLWYYEVEEHCMCGAIYAQSTYREYSLGSSTTYVLTGLPVVYFSDDAVPEEFEEDPEYYLQYNALGYPFKQNEWVQLPTIPMAGSPGTGTEFKVAEQVGFKPTLNSLDYGTLEPPPEPTPEWRRTYRHYGFCILGVYTDYSESLKFK